MFTSTRMNDGRVLMVEHRMCLHCLRMIVLNDEPFYRMYIPNWKGFAYSHKLCPPRKEEPKQLGHS